jgi:hypothetical protein
MCLFPSLFSFFSRAPKCSGSYPGGTLTPGWESLIQMIHSNNLKYVKWMIFQMLPNQISLCSAAEKDRNLEWKSQLETLDESRVTRSNTSDRVPYAFLVCVLAYSIRLATTHSRRDPLDRQFVFPSNSSSDVVF